MSLFTLIRLLFLTSSPVLNSTNFTGTNTTIIIPTNSAPSTRVSPPSSFLSTSTTIISNSSTNFTYYGNTTTSYSLPSETLITNTTTTVSPTNTTIRNYDGNHPLVSSSSASLTDMTVANATDAGRSYSNIYGNYFIGTGVAVFASICWSVWYVWSRGASYSTLIPLWIIYISLGDFISDFTFISQMPRSPELIETLRLSSIAFVMGASLLNVCVMVGYVVHILWRGGPAFTPFVRWLQVHRGVTIVLLVLSVTSARMFTLIFSGLFGISMFNAPLPISAMEILDLLGIITVIFEDVPQLIINIYISDATNTWDSVSYTAVAFSVVSVAISVGCRSITLIYLTDKSREHMQNAVLVDHLKGQRAFRKGTISHVRHMFEGGGTLGDPAPRRWSVRATQMPEIMKMLQKITKPKDAASSVDSDRDPMAVHNVYALVAKPLVVHAGTHIEPGQTPTSGNMMDALAAAYDMTGPSPPYYSTVNVLQVALNNENKNNSSNHNGGTTTTTTIAIHSNPHSQHHQAYGSPYSVTHETSMYNLNESPISPHSVNMMENNANQAMGNSPAAPPLRYPSEGTIIDEPRSPITSGTLGPLPTILPPLSPSNTVGARTVSNPFYSISRESSGTGLLPSSPIVLPPPLPPAVSFSRSISAASTTSIDSSSQLMMNNTDPNLPDNRGRVAATASMFNNGQNNNHPSSVPVNTSYHSNSSSTHSNNVLHNSHTSVRNILPPLPHNTVTGTTMNTTISNNRAERVGRAIGIHNNTTNSNNLPYSSSDPLSPYISPSNNPPSIIVPSPAPSNFTI